MVTGDSSGSPVKFLCDQHGTWKRGEIIPKDLHVIVISDDLTFVCEQCTNRATHTEMRRG